MTAVLSINKRENAGSNASNKLRKTGNVPGVVYGEKKDAVAISFSLENFIPISQQKVPILNLELGDKEQQVMIKKVQYDTYGERILHVDFQRINAKKKITLPIDIHFLGEPKGVQEGGMPNFRMRQLTISCYPNDVPESINIHIEDMDINQQKRVQDLNLSDKLTCENSPESTIVIIRPPRIQTETTDDDEAAATAETTEEPAQS